MMKLQHVGKARNQQCNREARNVQSVAMFSNYPTNLQNSGLHAQRINKAFACVGRVVPTRPSSVDVDMVINMLALTIS